MKLSKSSWHYKLYKFMYGKYAKEYTNLCPYFWKIILSVIFIIPLLILQAIPSLFRPRREEISRLGLSGKDNIGFALLINVAAFLTICMIVGPFKGTESPFFLAALIGYFITLVLGGSVIFCIIQEKRDNRPAKHKEPSLIKEFIKAKYNKYCPQIEWNEELRK